MYNVNMSVPKAVIESIDGTGKSTAAKDAAMSLSDSYRKRNIRVVDSDGVYDYRGGKLKHQGWSWMESLEPHQEKSRLLSAAKLGLFTLTRRAAEAQLSDRPDLVIGVRDPFRIDPAIYSTVFGPSFLKTMSSGVRLILFDYFTTAPHPDMIVNLHSDPHDARPVAGANGQLDSHETPEKLQLVHEEMQEVLGSYGRLFASQVVIVEALRLDTSDQVAAQIEPLLS
jgi:thymidylate kinase